MSSDSGSDSAGPVLNSTYYIEKFGSRSPEEYKSLRITNIDPKVGEHELDNVLRKIFNRFGEMHCKVVNPRDVHERIAYVNFDYAEDARDARHKGARKMLSLLGRKVRVDPANVVRDQGGKALRRQPGPGGQDTYRRSRSPPPPAENRYRRNDVAPRVIDHRTRPMSGGRSPPPYRAPGGGGGGGGGGRNFDMSPAADADHPRPTWEYKEGDPYEDSFASRTLFVGNLELDITINELRRFFERFGTVEEIDVKTPQNGVTAYAFVRFADILSAREARKHCSGEYLRDNRCIIGWGKPIVTRRLWVGGLGPDASLAWLEKEFDRFGPIEKMDFVRGDNHAYVLFADQRAAMEAFRKLRGLRTKNGVLENLIQVDFADASMYDRPGGPPRNSGGGGGAGGGGGDRQRRRSFSRSPSDRYRSGGGVKRQRSPSASPPSRRKHLNSGGYSPEDSPQKSRRGPDSAGRKRSPSPGRRRNGVGNGSRQRGYSPSTQRQTGLAAAAEFVADSLDDLHEVRSPIWTGVLVLKKSAYPLQLFKMAGDDDLVDAYLRNERGESVQLNITQRLKLDQPRTGEILRVSAAAMEHSAYLLAVPNPNVREDLVEKLADMQSKHLKMLVQYFVEKQAAGVVNTNAVHIGTVSSKIPQQGVLYAFPHCSFADDFVATLCPKLSVWQRAKQECLLLVLQKGASIGSSQTGGSQ